MSRPGRYAAEWVTLTTARNAAMPAVLTGPIQGRSPACPGSCFEAYVRENRGEAEDNRARSISMSAAHRPAGLGRAWRVVAQIQTAGSRRRARAEAGADGGLLNAVPVRSVVGRTHPGAHQVLHDGEAPDDSEITLSVDSP
jgi:hypothetical protein